MHKNEQYNLCFNVNNNAVEIVFDFGGNIYFEVNKKVYDINITDTLKLEEYIIKSDDDKVQIEDIGYGNIHIVKSNLKSKIDESLMENDSDEESDHEDDDDASYESIFYENKNIKSLKSTKNEDDNENEYVTFMNLIDTDIEVTRRQREEHISLYDVFVSKNNKIIYKTELVNVNPLYRVFIDMTEKTISFRNFDSDIREKLKFEYVKDNLILCKI